MAITTITNDWEQFQLAVDNVNYLAGRLRQQFMKGGGTSGGARGLAGTTGVGISGNNAGMPARRRQTRKRTTRRTGGTTL